MAALFCVAVCAVSRRLTPFFGEILIMTCTGRCLMAATALLFAWVKVGAAQEEPLCVENSPERRGEIGCSIVENKPLPGNLKEPLFWHIDRFETGDRARAAAGAASVAFEAHGAWWLMSIESQAESHHGGQHVTAVKLLSLPE